MQQVRLSGLIIACAFAVSLDRDVARLHRPAYQPKPSIRFHFINLVKGMLKTRAS